MRRLQTVALAWLVAWPAAQTLGGNLEPASAPAPTMRTLEDLPGSWHRFLTGADRFLLVMGGEGVLDRETGLVWQQSPATGTGSQSTAAAACANATTGARKGWRLPYIDELASLPYILAPLLPPLPSGHPFSNVQASRYWTATDLRAAASAGWTVDFGTPGGTIDLRPDALLYPAWCVRGASVGLKSL